MIEAIKEASACIKLIPGAIADLKAILEQLSAVRAQLDCSRALLNDLLAAGADTRKAINNISSTIGRFK